ncbi:MAG: hypothetical protein AAB152_11430 [Candidatus Coatesbacteria bacterium]
MKRRPGVPLSGSRGPAAPPARPLSPVSVVAALWAVMAFVAYARMHPPDPFSHLTLSITLVPLLELDWRGLLAPVPDLLLAGACLVFEVAGAFGFGEAAAAWLDLPWRTRAERTWIALLLGLGLFAFASYGAGTLGFYSAGSHAVLLGLGAVLALRAWRRGRVALPSRPSAPVSPWVRWGIGAAVLCQIGALASGFTPCHISDEGIYHLGYPQWYLQMGRAVAWPHNFFEFNPQVASMLYGPPLAFGLVFGVKWIHWVGGLLAAAGVWCLLHDAKPALRRAAVLLFLTIPTLWGFAGRGFNDGFLLAYATGALVAVRRASSRPGRGGVGWAWVAGAFVGIAAGMKYNGLFLWVLLWSGLTPRRMVAASVAATAVVSPWFLKSWIVTGNPVFPYGAHLLGGLDWDAHLAWRLAKEQMQGDFTIWQRLAALPVQLWNMPVLGSGGGPDSIPGPLIGPVVGLALAGATGRELAVLAAFFIPVAFSVPGLRFLFPLIPFALAIAARRLSGAAPGPRAARVVAAGFAFLLWVQAAGYFRVFWGEFDHPLPVIFRQVSIARYLDRRLTPAIYYPPSYSRMLKAAAENVPPDARILFLGGYGGAYWIPRPVLFTALESRPLPIPVSREAADASRIRVKFRQYGITHVIVNRWENEIFYDFWRMWDWAPGYEASRWIQFWDRYAVSVWRYGKVSECYRIARRPVVQPHRLTPGLEDEVGKLLGYMIRRRAFTEALPLLQTMISIFPTDPVFALRAVELAARQDKVFDAATLCAHLARMAPGSVELLRGRAAVCLARTQYAEAAVLVREICRRDARDAQAWLDLSMLCGLLDKREEAAWYKRISDNIKEFRTERW